MQRIRMGNDEFVLYIRKNHDCALTNSVDRPVSCELVHEADAITRHGSLRILVSHPLLDGNPMPLPPMTSVVVLPLVMPAISGGGGGIHTIFGPIYRRRWSTACRRGQTGSP